MTPEEKKDLRTRIDLGIKAGVASALEEHRLAGRKVTIWRDGQMVHILPPPRRAPEPVAVREDSHE